MLRIPAAKAVASLSLPDRKSDVVTWSYGLNSVWLQIKNEQNEVDFESDVYNGDVWNQKRYFSDLKGSFLDYRKADIFRK